MAFCRLRGQRWSSRAAISELSIGLHRYVSEFDQPLISCDRSCLKDLGRSSNEPIRRIPVIEVELFACDCNGMCDVCFAQRGATHRLGLSALAIGAFHLWSAFPDQDQRPPNTDRGEPQLMISIGKRRPVSGHQLSVGSDQQDTRSRCAYQDEPHSAQGLPSAQLLCRDITYVANNLDSAGH